VLATRGAGCGGGTLFGGTVRAGRVGDDGLRELPSSDRTARGDANAVPATGRRAAPIRSLALMLEDWLPALRGAPVDSGQAPSVPTLRDGLVVQRVIDAARRSSAGEGWVSLDA
jgi:predicted dehydrogenase